MIVVDASAVVDLVCDARGAAELRERMRGEATAHAPHLFDIEVAGALRRLAASSELSEDRAADALLDAAELPIVRYSHRPLIERAWELRGHLTISDGVYIALAELLDAPLLTADARLARAGGHAAKVELV